MQSMTNGWQLDPRRDISMPDALLQSSCMLTGTAAPRPAVPRLDRYAHPAGYLALHAPLCLMLHHGIPQVVHVSE